MFTTFTKLEEMLKKESMETCSLTLAKLIEGIFRPDDTSGHISLAEQVHFISQRLIYFTPEGCIYFARRAYIPRLSERSERTSLVLACDV